jgi:gliding motility-associated protein GldC
MKKTAKTSEIKFLVHLDEKNVPEAMTWEAEDSPEPGLQPCDAIIVSIWDPNAKNALRIDLWTKEMPVTEMGEFFYQTLVTMADSYLSATGNNEAASALKRFSEEFIGMARAREQN